MMIIPFDPCGLFGVGVVGVAGGTAGAHADEVGRAGWLDARVSSIRDLTTVLSIAGLDEISVRYRLQSISGRCHLPASTR